MWDGFRQETSISDVTRPQILKLHKGRRGFACALDYEVAGQLAGDVALLLLAGRVYETMPLAGAVAGKRGGDWYADTAVVA